MRFEIPVFLGLSALATAGQDRINVFDNAKRDCSSAHHTELNVNTTDLNTCHKIGTAKSVTIQVGDHSKIVALYEDDNCKGKAVEHLHDDSSNSPNPCLVAGSYKVIAPKIVFPSQVPVPSPSS